MNKGTNISFMVVGSNIECVGTSRSVTLPRKETKVSRFPEKVEIIYQAKHELAKGSKIAERNVRIFGSNYETGKNNENYSKNLIMFAGRIINILKYLKFLLLIKIQFITFSGQPYKYQLLSKTILRN